MKKSWIAIPLLLVVAGAGAYYYNQQQLNREPEGLARSNGRLQLERIDVAGLFAGRVEEVFVREGDKVTKDANLVTLSSDQYDSQLDAAIAQRNQASKLYHKQRLRLKRAKSNCA
ncbi:MAG TPA: biotin/lipoyl-binding protein [Oligella sp.]|nr:biotin/lipoyl-binding protein [Oligella sp.]